MVKDTLTYKTLNALSTALKGSERKMLSINLSGKNNKFFIMDNSLDKIGKPKGQVPDMPYFDTMKAATIAMFRLCHETKKANLYDMSQRKYQELTA